MLTYSWTEIRFEIPRVDVEYFLGLYDCRSHFVNVSRFTNSTRYKQLS